MNARPDFDKRDQEIVDLRKGQLDQVTGPRVGDWVYFADGIQRRVSHVWDWHDGSEVMLQTSAEGGGYYLGDGYVSFSGTLYCSVGASTLTLTEEKRNGQVWIFHHDWHQAHNGVHSSIPFRIYTCTENAPS